MKSKNWFRFREETEKQKQSDREELAQAETQKPIGVLVEEKRSGSDRETSLGL